MTGASAIPAGFADPVLDAQAAFRALLDVLANPGTIAALPALPGEPGDAGIRSLLQTMADHETPVWLPPALAEGSLGRFLRFHCSAPLAPAPAQAMFAVLDGREAEPALAAFDPGEARYPDRSATLLVTVPSLEGGAPVRLTGPGLETDRVIGPAGLRQGFWDEVAANAARYPLGVDLVLICGRRIMGLPRTTQVAMMEPA